MRGSLRPMRAYVVARAGEIAPFARRPDACGLGPSTFGAYRAEALRAIGGGDASFVDDGAAVEGPALVVSDDVFVTKRALKGFVRAARARPAPSRLCLPPSRLLELMLPLQDVPLDDGRAGYEVAYVPAGATARAGDALALPPSSWVPPPYKEILVDVPIPRYIMGAPKPSTTFPLTTTIAMRVRHWLHVLRASHVMPQVLLVERATANPVGAALRALRAVRATRPATLRALRARFVYVGKDVFIHPRATVEASILGDGVRVGAHAYVNGAVLGPGTIVEERAHVVQTCTGPSTFVSRNSVLSACAVFGDTDACVNGMQGCVVAEKCGLTSFAHPLDIVPGGRVKVDDGGVLREVGELPCGVAFGEGVFLGAGVYVAPGRAIPAGTRLVGDPATTLRRIGPADAGALGYVDDGTLRRL